MTTGTRVVFVLLVRYLRREIRHVLLLSLLKCSGTCLRLVVGFFFLSYVLYTQQRNCIFYCVGFSNE